MEIREFALRFAALYDTPIQLKDNEDNDYDNPKIIGAEKWVDDNFISGERLRMFYNFVEKRFIPTDAVRYPTPANLENIYKEYQNNKSIKPISQNEFKPLTIEDKRKAKSDMKGVKRECPKEYLNIDISVVAEDNKKMTKLELLKKYGTNLCGELWSDGVYSRHGYFKSRNKKVGKNEVGRAF